MFGTLQDRLSSLFCTISGCQTYVLSLQSGTTKSYAHNTSSSITLFSFLVLSRYFTKLIFHHSKCHRICFLLPRHHAFFPLLFSAWHLLFMPQSNLKFIFHDQMWSEIKTRHFRLKGTAPPPHYWTSCHPPHHWLKTLLFFSCYVVQNLFLTLFRSAWLIFLIKLRSLAKTSQFWQEAFSDQGWNKDRAGKPDSPFP